MKSIITIVLLLLYVSLYSQSGSLNLAIEDTPVFGIALIGNFDTGETYTAVAKWQYGQVWERCKKIKTYDVIVAEEKALYDSAMVAYKKWADEHPGEAKHSEPIIDYSAIIPHEYEFIKVERQNVLMFWIKGDGPFPAWSRGGNLPSGIIKVY